MKKSLFFLLVLLLSLSLIPLASAYTMDVPTNNYFGFGTGSYVNFNKDMTFDSTKTYLDNGFRYFDGYGFQAQNANITITNFFSDGKLAFTVSASSGITSTTKIYCGYKGKPLEINPASANGGYDDASKIQTITWLHSSAQPIELIWERAASGLYILSIQTLYNMLPCTATVEINGINQTSNIFGSTTWNLPYGTYTITARWQNQNQTKTILLSEDLKTAFNFITPPSSRTSMIVPLVMLLGFGFLIFLFYPRLFRRRK